MKTGVRIRIIAGTMLIIAAMAGMHLQMTADTGLRLLEQASDLPTEAALNLLPAIAKLVDDDRTDIGELRAFFMEDPRGYLAENGVVLPESDYEITAYDVGALRKIPGVFDDSSMADGFDGLPILIGFQSDKMAICLEAAVKLPPRSQGDSDGATGFTLTPGEAATQPVVRLVVTTPEDVLQALRHMLGLLTVNDDLRARAVEVSFRQFVSEQVGVILPSDQYAVQIINLEPLGDVKPIAGVHYTVSEAQGPTKAEVLGVAFLRPDAPSYMCLIASTF